MRTPPTSTPCPRSKPTRCPDPELARYDKLTQRANSLSRSAETAAAPSGALGVLAQVLDRDGRQLSATQTLHQSLADDADHLAILNSIWADQTNRARHQRYATLLAGTLPPGYRQEPGHQAKWLWQTLHAAELAGLDARQVLAEAIGERDLAGARDIPAVIDARICRRAGSLVPQPQGLWSAQVPELADPAARLQWQQRASAIGAWRELSGYDHPADPIGPEPAIAAPGLRAAWREALAALGPTGGPDVRGMPDGLLAYLRDTHPVETAWAPHT